MTEPAKSERGIFLEALKLDTPQELTAFLEDACAGDVALLERVQDLLSAHEKSGGPLDSPAADGELAPTVLQADIEKPGGQIGPYKLLQEIGQGGMGVVYMAQQSQPVERRVAVKIIKPGMDTQQVIARFEAERQALAIMDHPNIAKVLDAGVTPGGRPYFAMELVKGIPINEYCDRNRLTLNERLELFRQTCQAVQHAHQKGIIHRDIELLPNFLANHTVAMPLCLRSYKMPWTNAGVLRRKCCNLENRQ